VIAPSRIHSFGCYTTLPIKKGAQVVEYTGEVVSVEEADRRYEESDHTFLFGLSDGKGVIDGNGVAAFINHSCDGNCETEEVDGHIWIVALRDIAAGEELSYDYCMYDGDGNAPCNCGAPKCRGTMYVKKPKRRSKSKTRPKPSRKPRLQKRR
jgi:SET domain-containing protein